MNGVVEPTAPVACDGDLLGDTTRRRSGAAWVLGYLFGAIAASLVPWLDRKDEHARLASTRSTCCSPPA